MANLNYPGETWLITRSLTDKNDAPIDFVDLESLEIQLIDSRKYSITYTISAGDIVVGSTSSSYKLEVPKTDTINFCPGPLTGRFTYEFPSADFTGNATDIIEEEILTIA